MITDKDLEQGLRPRLFELNTALGTRYDIFKIDPVTYAVVGDYYEGKNLRQAIEENQRVTTEDEVKDFLLQMSRRWLTPLFSRRLIHHDIKPENIIANNDVYSLIDFGGIKSLDAQSLSMSTGTDQIRSWGYSRFYGERSLQDDLYSLGKVAAFMLTAKDPNFTTNEETDRTLNQKLIEALKVNDKIKRVIGRLLSVHEPYSIPEEIALDLEERTRQIIIPSQRLPFLDYCLPTEYNDRVNALKQYFKENYLRFGPQVRPLSDEFKRELEELIKLVRFVDTSRNETMKKRDYYPSTGQTWDRKLIDKPGYEAFWYFNQGNFYFGLLKTNKQHMGHFNKYVSKRLSASRKRGIINRIVYVYSPYCWDDRILANVLTPYELK